MTKKQYNSGRVERTSQLGITSDRYQFLGLDQAEPNLGDPKVGPSSTGANPIPIGQVYQVVSVDTTEGERFWTPLVGFGTTVGVISVYENGVLPGGDNRFQRIHGLNFVGNGVTIKTPPVDGPFEGVGIATIQFALNELVNQGEIGQVIYNSSSGTVDGAPDFYYNPNSQFVGIGSTQPSVKLDVDGDSFVSGVLTSHFYQTGTGAVKRTVESKLKEPYISITDFGAIPNNFAIDNGVYIQAAINAAQNNSVTTVYVPRGTWWCSTPIQISNAITLIGDGAEGNAANFKSEIRFIYDVTNPNTIGDGGRNVAIGVYSDGGATNIKNFIMRDIALRTHSSLDGYNITGLLLRNHSDGRIQDCAFIRFDNSLTLEGCARMIITNNYFGCNSKTNKANHAISLRDDLVTNSVCTGNHITDNEIVSQTTVLPCWERAIEILSSDAVYLNHNHLKDYNIGLYVRASGISPLGDIHSSNQYFDRYYKHCILVESQAGDDDIRDLLFNSDYFRGGQTTAECAIKIDNDPSHNVIQSLTFIGCRIADSSFGPGIAITNPIPQVRNLNLKDCEFRKINRRSLSLEYNHAHLCAINASITGNIFDSEDTTYLSGSGATNGKCVVVSTGTSQYIFSDNIFYTSNDNNNVVTLPVVDARQVFGNIHNNQYLENFSGSVENLKGGAAGNIVYQSNVGITSFVSSVGANEKFLKYDGTSGKPVWSDVTGVTISNLSVSEDSTNTTRYLPFVDVSNGITTIRSNNSLVFNPSSLSVGIGTTTPTRNLDVNGTVRIRKGLYDVNNQVGSSSSVLTSTGNGINWTDSINLSVGYASSSGYSTSSGYATTSGIATNLASGATGSIPYQSNSGVTTFLAGSGTNGAVLEYNNNAPRWVVPSNLSVGYSSSAGYASTAGYSTSSGYATTSGIATNLNGGNPGTLVYQSSANNTAFISTTGAADKFLQFKNGLPTWSDIPGVSTITVNSDNTNNTRFIPFVDNVGGATTLRGNSLLAFNPSNSRIGIGTSTLNATLNVVPISNSVAGLFSGSSTNNLVVINQSGSGNALFVDETQPFVISGIGSVGIGTATPSHLLDVNGVVRLRGALRDSNNQAGTLTQVLQSTGTGVSWATLSTSSGVSTGGSLDLYENNTKVGAATSLRFVSTNLTVSVASSVGVVTLTNTPTFTTVTSGRFLSTTSNILVGNNSGLNLNTALSLGNVIIGGDAGRGLSGCDHNNNIMIGGDAGCCLTSGVDNIIMGKNVAGPVPLGINGSVIIGNNNVSHSTYNSSIIMGAYSGSYGDGSSNIFLGNYVGGGVEFSSYPGQINNNIFIGDGSGGLVDGSSDNIAIGRSSGYTVKGAINNVYLGPLAGYGNEIGRCNFFAGFCAGYGSTTFDPTGCTVCTRACNVFIGPRSGLCLGSGNNNIFLGANSGLFIDDGCRNIFIGREAGQGLNENNLIQGCNNVAIGVCALTNITNASGNIALAQCSQFTLTTGFDNITMGRDSGFSITSSCGNIILGKDSGSRVTTGNYNVIIGHQSGLSTTRNITGSQNIILSSRSVNFLTSGSSNIIIGAGHSINTGVNNITINPPNGNTGLESLTGGETSASTYVGSALTTLSGISSTIVIGNTGITNFYTKMAQKSGGSAVSWNSSTNELTAATSSRRFKTDIRPYSSGIDELIKLESVRYKPIENPNDVDYVGLIAEQVDEAGLTEFVVYDIDNEPLSLSYDRMIALAINSIKELKSEIETLKKRIDTLEAQ